MGHSAERSETKRFCPTCSADPKPCPLLLFILFFRDPLRRRSGTSVLRSMFLKPPWLLFALNTIFITGLGLLIAWLCFRSFLRGGFLNILLLGCGVLAFGIVLLCCRMADPPQHGPNDAVTIHNIGVLCTAVLYFLSSLFTAFGFSMEIETRRGLIAAATYSAVFAVGGRH